MPTNINDATYFELRLIEEICLERSLPFKFTADLNRYKSLIKKSHGQEAQEKMNIQEARLKSGLETFLSHLNKKEVELSKTLVDINWVGRKDLGDRVADLDLVFSGEVILPISAKSGGPGTERNLGGDSLRDLLGYDSTKTLDKMKSETINSLTFKFPKVTVATSWKEIRMLINASPDKEELTLLANAVGYKYQSLLSTELLEAWQKATEKQKIALISYLALQNDPRDKGLQIFIAEDNGAYFKHVLDISSLNSNDFSLIKYKHSSKGTLELLIRSEPYWRLNVNFTNGLGLSPLAIRVFSI